MLARTTTKLFFVGIILWLFCTAFNMHLFFCIFLAIFWHYVWRRDIIRLLLFTVWTFWESLIHINIPNRILLNSVNEKSFKRNKSLRWKCCQLKALKMLLMYLLATLLIKKYLVAATYILSSIYSACLYAYFFKKAGTSFIWMKIAFSLRYIK